MRLVQYTYPAYRSFAPAAGIFARSPWSTLESEIDRLLSYNSPADSARFPVDLFDDKANTYVRAELPGVDRADINVEVTDGFLTITATRKPVTPTAASTETPATDAPPATVTLKRSVRLSDEVQADRIGAAYENGVLTITLPKSEPAQPKKITVAVK